MLHILSVGNCFRQGGYKPFAIIKTLWLAILNFKLINREVNYRPDLQQNCLIITHA